MDVKVSKGHVKVINVKGSAIQQSPQEGQVRDDGLENPRSLRAYRVPFPEKGKHASRRGRKATGRSWSLNAGLPKDRITKGRC